MSCGVGCDTKFIIKDKGNNRNIVINSKIISKKNNQSLVSSAD